MEPITAAIIGAGAQSANSLVQMIGQRRRERRAVRNQQHLMDIHQIHQQQLNKQGHDLQMDTWNKTNYPAQVKMLQEAGMNPALLYGKGGSGGVTGSQGGGSAASGQAPMPQPMPNVLPNAMDIANIAKLKSEIKVNESVADRNNAEAKKTSGADTELAIGLLAKYQAEIETEAGKQLLMQVQKEQIELDNKLKTASFEDSLKILENQVEQGEEHIRQLKIQNNLSEATYEDMISRNKAEALGAWLDNRLAKENISREHQNIMLDKWKTNIEQCLANENIRIADMNNAIKQYEADIKAFYPSIWQVGGHLGTHFVGNAGKEGIKAGADQHNATPGSHKSFRQWADVPPNTEHQKTKSGWQHPPHRRR